MDSDDDSRANIALSNLSPNSSHTNALHYKQKSSTNDMYNKYKDLLKIKDNNMHYSSNDDEDMKLDVLTDITAGNDETNSVTKVKCMCGTYFERIHSVTKLSENMISTNSCDKCNKFIFEYPVYVCFNKIKHPFGNHKICKKCYKKLKSNHQAQSSYETITDLNSNLQTPTLSNLSVNASKHIHNNETMFSKRKFRVGLYSENGEMDQNVYLCGCGKKYPKYYPNIYLIGLILFNMFRIMSLMMDLILFINCMQYNDHFGNFGNNQVRNYIPFTIEFHDRWRVVLTLYFGIIFFGYICYHIPKSFCGWHLICSVPILLIVNVLFYKGILIILLMFRIYLYCQYAGKYKIITNAIENRLNKFEIIIILEEIFSSWPLFIVTLIDFQDTYAIFSNVTVTETIYILKLVFALITIIVDSNDVFQYISSLIEKKILVITCENTNKWMKVIQLSSKNNDDKEIKCFECAMNIIHRSNIGYVNVFHCHQFICPDYLCTKCGWTYFIKYKKRHTISDKKFYSYLPSLLKKMYQTELHKIAYKSSGFIKHKKVGDTMRNFNDILPLLYKENDEWIKYKKHNNIKLWCITILSNIIAIFVCCSLIPTFIDGWIYNNIDDYILKDGSLFVIISLCFRILYIIIQLFSFCIHKFNDNCNIFSFWIKWFYNIHYISLLIGFILILISFIIDIQNNNQINIWLLCFIILSVLILFGVFSFCVRNCNLKYYQD